ncbi:MAG: cobalt ECF transporter T component CbiQ, partial [Thermodesulfovibrionales bacterium]|nr:cobalt ECF transporter T component CbiQ [Thermodesulfovibrionales bacterium]
MELFSEYFNKEHFLARVDARIKIFVSLAVMIMVLSYRGFMLPLFVLSLCLLLSIWMKIPVKTLMLRFSEPLFIAFIIMIVKLFSGKVILFSINIMDVNISGYKDGFIDGLIIALRILGAVSVLSVTGFSTPFTEFIAGLSWLRVPKGIIEILMFAYRYIFVLLEDAMVIYNAQKNRLGYTNIRRGLSSFG